MAEPRYHSSLPIYDVGSTDLEMSISPPTASPSQPQQQTTPESLSPMSSSIAAASDSVRCCGLDPVISCSTARKDEPSHLYESILPADIREQMDALEKRSAEILNRLITLHAENQGELAEWRRLGRREADNLAAIKHVAKKREDEMDQRLENLQCSIRTLHHQSAERRRRIRRVAKGLEQHREENQALKTTFRDLRHAFGMVPVLSGHHERRRIADRYRPCYGGNASAYDSYRPCYVPRHCAYDSYRPSNRQTAYEYDRSAHRHWVPRSSLRFFHGC
jgi:hypothetical protein